MNYYIFYGLRTLHLYFSLNTPQLCNFWRKINVVKAFKVKVLGNFFQLATFTGYEHGMIRAEQMYNPAKLYPTACARTTLHVTNFGIDMRITGLSDGDHASATPRRLPAMVLSFDLMAIRAPDDQQGANVSPGKLWAVNGQLVGLI